MDSCTVAKGKLPKEVQDALNRDYRNCCEVVVNKDSSTIQKHKFSNRHCTNLPQELQELLPSFTCPAFVAMHGLCRSAKYVSSPVITKKKNGGNLTGLFFWTFPLIQAWQI